jgi:hypothetical protein
VRNGRGARLARGSAIALFATFIASLAHTVGGGLAPGLLTVVLALAFSVPFAIATVGRQAGLVRASIAAIGAQLALHALYSLGPAGAPAQITMTDASAGALHAHMSPHVHVEQAAAEPAAAHGAHPATWMWLAHAAAAALTIVFIACTDRVLAAVVASARGIRLAWRLLTAPVAAPRRVGTRRPEASTARLARDLHLLSRSHRGPPVALPAA